MKMSSRNEVSGAPSKLKMLVTAIGLSFIIISYQNCGQPNRQDSSATKISIQTNLSALNQIDLIKEGNTDKGPYDYSVNLVSGVVEKFYLEIPREHPDNQNLGTFCLDENSKELLKNTITASVICSYTSHVPPGTVCTAQYAYPHSIVHSGGYTLNLGEKRNGCPGEYFDICQNQLNNYLSVRQSILDNIENMSCHPEIEKDFSKRALHP